MSIDLAWSYTNDLCVSSFDGWDGCDSCSSPTSDRYRGELAGQPFAQLLSSGFSGRIKSLDVKSALHRRKRMQVSQLYSHVGIVERL